MPTSLSIADVDAVQGGSATCGGPRSGRNPEGPVGGHLGDQAVAAVIGGPATPWSAASSFSRLLRQPAGGALYLRPTSQRLLGHGIRAPPLAPVLERKGAEGEQVISGVDEHGRHVGELGLEGATMRSDCSATAPASGWAKIVRMAAATISALVLVTLANTLRMKCTRRALQGAPMNTLRWRP